MYRGRGRGKGRGKGRGREQAPPDLPVSIRLVFLLVSVKFPCSLSLVRRAGVIWEYGWCTYRLCAKQLVAVLVCIARGVCGDARWGMKRFD